MDLRKIVEGSYESEYYSATGEEIDRKTCELLGYKEGKPVVRNKKDEAKKPPTNHSTKKDTSPKPGEKFINLNGKKLWMVTESHFKTNHRTLTTTPTICANQKPIKIKLIGTMPSILQNAVRLDPSLQTNGSKYNVNKTDNSGRAKLSCKTLITEGKPAIVKNPNDYKVIARYSTTACTLDGFASQTGGDLQQQGNWDSKPNIFKCDGIFKTVNGSLKMNPLDLTKVTKVDKAVQVGPETADQEVQSEEDDPLLNCIDMNFLELLNSNLPPGALFNPPAPKSLTSKEMSTGTDPLLSGATHSQNFKMFFHDLRTALVPNINGNMPIHEGVLTNNISFVQKSCSILKALQTPVDVPKNQSDLTALQLAILTDADPQIVKTLLGHGASLEVVDSEGNNIIHLAVDCKRTGLLDILLRFADEHKFNLNEFNAEGLTPLMICCCNNLLQCADLLIKYDANVNVRDRKSGRTALFHAAEHYHLELVQLLLKCNADTKIKNFFGTSPHDAMYEVDEIPDTIKSLILSRSSKRKNTEEVKVLKVRRTGDSPSKLKTYARYKKIEEGYNFPATMATMAK